MHRINQKTTESSLDIFPLLCYYKGAERYTRVCQPTQAQRALPWRVSLAGSVPNQEL